MRNRLIYIGMLFSIALGCFIFSEGVMALPPINYCRQMDKHHEYLLGYDIGRRLNGVMYFTQPEINLFMSGFTSAWQHKPLDKSQQLVLEKIQISKILSPSFVPLKSRDQYYLTGYGLYQFFTSIYPQEQLVASDFIPVMQKASHGLRDALEYHKLPIKFVKLYTLYKMHSSAREMSTSNQYDYALGYYAGRDLMLSVILKKGISINSFIRGFSDSFDNKKLPLKLRVEWNYYKFFVSTSMLKTIPLEKRKIYSYLDGYHVKKSLFEELVLDSTTQPSFKKGFADGVRQVKLNNKMSLLVSLVGCNI